MRNSDPAELDFFSTSFNPLRALNDAELQAPEPSARPLDNLYRCRRLLPRHHPDHLQPVEREAAGDGVVDKVCIWLCVCV